MEITGVEATILRDPVETGDAAGETVLVAVTSDTGVTGYGDANAASAAVKAMIDRDHPAGGGWDDGIRATLVGADPRDPAALWRRLKDSTFWSSRAGVGHVALAGVDMALWDLAGKLAGVPTWQLLGPRRNEDLRAYVTVWHGGGRFADSLARSLETLDAALDAGYRAVKVEALEGNTEHVGQIVELAARARERVGDEIDLLLDVGYRFGGYDEAVDVVRELDDLNLVALEAPFPPHRVDDHLRLREAVGTPIATGDCLTAALEHFPLLDAGAIDIAQAGAPRTGVSDMDALARRAARTGRRFVPWGWVPTALSVAANLHLCVVHDNVPLIEYAPPELYSSSPLRHELAGPEPPVRNGAFALPTAPGLGVEVDPDVVARLAR